MQYIGLYAKARHYCKVCLGVSKDQLLKKYPEQKEAVEFFVSRVPNGNPKYVEWELKVLQARQAMKEEIADVIVLFEKFRAFYRGEAKISLPELRQRYNLLLLKVLSLLQDGDAQLAAAISSSREAIWAILADPDKFAKI